MMLLWVANTVYTLKKIFNAYIWKKTIFRLYEVLIIKKSANYKF